MNKKDRIKDILNRMSMEEKLKLCVGKDFWHTRESEDYGIPSVVLTDGPHGLRKQDGEGNRPELGESVKAVCFPSGSAIASSFNPDMAELVGTEIGKLARAEQVRVVLGPAMNIKRSPLCGL